MQCFFLLSPPPLPGLWMRPLADLVTSKVARLSLERASLPTSWRRCALDSFLKNGRRNSRSNFMVWGALPSTLNGLNKKCSVGVCVYVCVKIPGPLLRYTTTASMLTVVRLTNASAAFPFDSNSSFIHTPLRTWARTLELLNSATSRS